jgi:hypothetical protein
VTPIDPWSELAELTAALCDGQLDPEQAARLEQLADESDESRGFFLRYLQLHGELLWDHAVGAGREERSSWSGEAPASGEPARRAAGVRLVRRWGWVAAALAASLVLAALWLPTRGPHGPAPDVGAAVARLVRSIDADVTCRGNAVAEDADLVAGQRLHMAHGLAEIHFACGARVIVEGPAAVDLESAGRLFVHRGRLVAHASGEAAGFAVATDTLVVIDRGTEFGLSVAEAGPCEVHVFDGAVDLQSPQGPLDPPRSWKRLRAGQAARVLAAAHGDRPQIEDIVAQADRFVRDLPPREAGSVAALRRIVASQPRLIHHYPFEGASPEDRLRDRRGNLDLTEAVMRDGAGASAIAWDARGFDATTRAVRLGRARISGNARGVGLQSDAVFLPPAEMTVELLLRLDDSGDLADGAIRAALATRQSRRACGFFVMALDHGQLGHLLDGQAPWVLGEPDAASMPGVEHFALIPGDWYYVAATFRAGAGQTLVNSYAANLSRGDRLLARVVRDCMAPGVPAAGRLGIGKGFDDDLAHAYPWSGELDEVAIYDAVLDAATLQRHLDAVTGRSPP